MKDLIEKLYAKESKRIYYENFIRDEKEEFRINGKELERLCTINGDVGIVYDENEDFMFLSDRNLFMTILLSKRNDLKSVLCELDCEFMICNRESYNDLRWGKVDIV